MGSSDALSGVEARADVTHTVVALLSPSCSSFASRGEVPGMVLQPYARQLPVKSDRAAVPRSRSKRDVGHDLCTATHWRFRPF
jgi:hypothetical protein